MMYMRSGGSFLIEAIIYCLLVMLLTSLLFASFVRSGNYADRLRKHAQVYAALQAAGDLLARDIQMAPADSTHWKKIDPHELVWRMSDIDRGWSLTKNKLERTEGIYYSNSGWRSSTKGLVVDHVNSIRFDVKTAQNKHGKKSILSITYSLTSNINDKKITIERTLMPRNRMV